MCVVDYLISRALTGKEWPDAKHVHNYILGSRPKPPLPTRLVASSGKTPWVSATLPAQLGALVFRSRELSYFCVHMWEGWEDCKKSEKMYVSKYFKGKRGKLIL